MKQKKNTLLSGKFVQIRVRDERNRQRRIEKIIIY